MAIRYEQIEATALITIDRPDKLNALTLEMYRELGVAFDAARDDDAIAAVVLTGAGRAFCVGADLTESIPALASGELSISNWDGAHQKHTRLYKPVICAINGLALGGGFEIMLSTDLRIAGDQARFGLPESRVGVVPAGGTLARLARQISYARAMELLLMAQQVDAQTAMDFGLINAVVPQDEVLNTALAWARQLAAFSGDALEVIKESVHHLADMPLDAAFHAEDLYARKAFASPDAKEGIRAFADGRPAQFPSRRRTS
ncbi:enoyl-CoA hydratase/isomerase family protein [Rhodococcus sp. 14-2470-1a]|uniref:enoyl-CoA hydratase/isomerase family protein n=1 Tax=Rhodococcus sp. 14-2470-1a TaxID=2023150 RepID=UPI000B9A35BE|nr:enoyl-CoA hydratase/isomerase family protein [Rhodococcus sp. 14-2470-1a]OZF42603.1 enoyl-CoA hydratase [Rhodococcus sp. 14-2470-1a]